MAVDSAAADWKRPVTASKPAIEHAMRETGSKSGLLPQNQATSGETGSKLRRKSSWRTETVLS
jgi:hypothetical protein